MASAPGLATAQDSIDITVDVGELVVVGEPPPLDITVDVGELVVVGEPDPLEITVDVGELVIVGEPDPLDITVDVGELVVVGEPDPLEITIDVQELVVVGEPDDPDEQENQDRQEDPQNNSNPEDDLNITTNAADSPEPEEQIGGSGTTGDSPNQPGAPGTWCNGTYAVTLGQPRFVPAGPPIGRVETASAQVTTSQCTAQMSVTVAGGTVAMTRNGGQHIGSTIAPEGQKVTYTLTCQPDLSISGYLEASDGAITIQRDIEMRRTGGAEADLTGCPDGSGH